MPKAPKLLGALVGLGIAENAVPAGKLADLYGKVEDTEARRQGVAEALLYVKASPPSLSLRKLILAQGPAARLGTAAESCDVASGSQSLPGRGPFNPDVQDQPVCSSAPRHSRALRRRVWFAVAGA